MDMYPKSRIRLSRRGVIFCGEETDGPEIPDMTRVQRYCLVVEMSCAEVFSVGKLLPRGKLIIKSKPRPSAPPSKSLPARVIVGYILKLNPDVSRKHIHRNSREKWHPDVSSTNKNMVVLLLETTTETKAKPKTI